MKINRQLSMPAPRNRGSVIVLVVAVLALLAIIGTVYIVTSRSERGTAREMQVAANIDYAQQALLNNVSQVIVGSTTDGNGLVGGYNFGAGLPFGATMARRWTIPEENAAANGASVYNSAIPDLPWLVSDLFKSSTPPPNTDLNAAAFRPDDSSFLNYRFFDTRTGLYDLTLAAVSTATVSTNAFNAISGYDVTNPGFFSNYPASATPGIYPLPAAVAGTPLADSYINLLPLSDAAGFRYRFGLRIIDTSRMANLNVGYTYNANDDPYGALFNSYWLGSPSIFDSGNDGGAMNNLDSLYGRTGAAGPTSLYAWNRRALNFENPIGLSLFDISDELELRAYGNMGTAFIPRPAMNNISASAVMWPNTLGYNPPGATPASGNHRRDFFTTYSYSRALRPYLLQTDDPNLTAVPFAYTLNGTNNVIPGAPAAGVVWPPFPAPVSALPDVTVGMFDPAATVDPLKAVVDAGGAADVLAIAATNLASAMERIGGFPQEEALSYAANYLSYRWSGWINDPALAAATDKDGTSLNTLNRGPFYLPLGPTFIDDTGICIRAIDPMNNPYRHEYNTTAVATDLKSERTGKIYLGYTAQPFLNEIAENVHSDGAGNATVSDAAIELYNPYNVAISLNGFKLRIKDSPLTEIDLTGNYIRPRGYFVITQQGSGGYYNTVKPIDPQATTQIGVSTLDLTTSAKIYLVRMYTNRGGATQYAAVDQFDLTQLNTAVAGQVGAPAAAVQDDDYIVRRSNDDPVAQYTNLGYAPRWSVTVHVPAYEVPVHDAAATEISLGAANPTVGLSLSEVLYDRYAASDALPIQPQRSVLVGGLVEFNRIPRIAHEIDTAAAPAGNPAVQAGDNALLETHLAAKLSTVDPVLVTAGLTGTIANDSGIHFNFNTPASVFPGTRIAPAAGAPADSSPAHPCDFRAVKFLDSITFTDRVSDYTIDLGDNVSGRGLSKLRIPGQINVNTAPAEVLASIPYLNVPAHAPYVGAILAYRWRTTSTDARIPAAYQSGTFDFSDQTAYPGYGIRSMGELMNAFLPDPAFSGATSLEARDLAWSSIYNLCTVRSDTFIVYGYLEAIRQNPQYTASTISETDWYGTNGSTNPGTYISDGPSTTAKFLRGGRRRFIALIDSSYCNYNRLNWDGTPNLNFTLPKIVAFKVLPN